MKKKKRDSHIGSRVKTFGKETESRHPPGIGITWKGKDHTTTDPPEKK